MQEKEMSTPFYPDITEDQAAEILLEAFEQDPKLQIITGTTHTDWDILVNYTIPKGEYREGELARFMYVLGYDGSRACNFSTLSKHKER